MDADLSPGREATSIEAAGLVDDSTGEGIYYADAAGASAAQATYVKVEAGRRRRLGCTPSWRGPTSRRSRGADEGQVAGAFRLHKQLVGPLRRKLRGIGSWLEPT
jgi:hypothetical protein